MRTPILLLLLLSLTTACASGPSKSELDVEVKRLCAIDGGVKVYETVILPADKFNQWGQINFFHPTQGENALGTEYIYRSENLYLREGNPEIRKDHVQIYRKLDMKLLGEVVAYIRGGGDLPGPWQPSAYHCPDARNANSVVLMSKIFVKNNASSVVSVGNFSWFSTWNSVGFVFQTQS